MKMSTRMLTSLCAFVVAAASAQAQFYKLHDADISGGAIGQFTTILPTGNSTGVTENNKDSFGGIFSIRDYPAPWAGVEFNYAYTEYGSTIAGPTFSNNVHTDAHEATAAYIFHPKHIKFKPFLAVGGGYIDFIPSYAGQNQWRGTGLVELGFDINTKNPHFGFKLEGRELVYRSPNFNQSDLSSRQWVATSEPVAGVWYRF